MATIVTNPPTQEHLRPAFLDGQLKRMLINGQWVEAASGKTFASLNPSTGETLAMVAEGDAEDINRAVVAARRAFEGPWSMFKPYDRQQVLLKLADLVEKHFDEFCALDTMDMGAPISRTTGGKRRVLGMLRYYASMAVQIHGETIENALPGDYVSYTLKEPVGVVGAIIPWNGPLSATVWKVGPALATGCTMVLKPAEEAPLTPLRFGELLLEAGVPEGVINIVPGYGETGRCGLAAHPDVDKAAFTGSAPHRPAHHPRLSGQSETRVARTRWKSPDVVFADADLAAAVPGAAMAVFSNSGQILALGRASLWSGASTTISLGRSRSSRRR
jgi:aldehyde dehydrogenase (NAD+)